MNKLERPPIRRRRVREQLIMHDKNEWRMKKGGNSTNNNSNKRCSSKSNLVKIQVDSELKVISRAVKSQKRVVYSQRLAASLEALEARKSLKSSNKSTPALTNN